MAEDIEELRRRRMQQLMQQQMQQQQQESLQEQMQEAEISNQIRFIISNILSQEARQRLANIRVARPQYARQIEILLIQLKQTGRLSDRLSDDDFKKILMKISGGKREGNVSYRKTD